MTMKHWNDRHADMGRWGLEIDGKEVLVLKREPDRNDDLCFFTRTYIGGARTEFCCQAEAIDEAKAEAEAWYKSLLETRISGLQKMIRCYRKDIKALEK